MSDLTLILLAAGDSTRFALGVKKQWLRIADEPLWLFVANRYEKTKLFKKIIITSSATDIDYMKNHSDFCFVTGGSSRQESLKNAMLEVNTTHVLVSDIARACVSEEFLKRVASHVSASDCVVPFLHANDTTVFDNKTIDRGLVKRVQTPQLSLTSALNSALMLEDDFTDESSAIVANGGSREFILGEEDAHKITSIKDLKNISCLSAPSADTFSGNGFDVHAFDDKGEMFLGGVKIDSDFGFKAHSDGDVAIHALIDALLGAAGIGDIGMLFPDNDDAYRGVDSKFLLREVVTKIHNFGFVVVNVDLTIIAQTPRLLNYKTKIRKTLSEVLKVNMQRVNVKATTTEKLGFIGRSEGVGVIANANLKYFDWTKI